MFPDFEAEAMPPTSFPPHRAEERLQLFHELLETGEIDLLLAVAEGFGGVWVDFDEEAVGAHGHGAFAERAHEVGPAAALAGIDDHRQVRFLLRRRPRRRVEVLRV